MRFCGDVKSQYLVAVGDDVHRHILLAFRLVDSLVIVNLHTVVHTLLDITAQTPVGEREGVVVQGVLHGLCISREEKEPLLPTRGATIQSLAKTKKKGEVDSANART